MWLCLHKYVLRSTTHFNYGVLPQGVGAGRDWRCTCSKPLNTNAHLNSAQSTHDCYLDRPILTRWNPGVITRTAMSGARQHVDSDLPIRPVYCLECEV